MNYPCAGRASQGLVLRRASRLTCCFTGAVLKFLRIFLKKWLCIFILNWAPQIMQTVFLLQVFTIIVYPWITSPPPKTCFFPFHWGNSTLFLIWFGAWLTLALRGLLISMLPNFGRANPSVSPAQTSPHWHLISSPREKRFWSWLSVHSSLS